MPEVIGIDHVYFSVSDMARSEAFYDIVLGQVLGFRKNRFSLNGDAHVQFYNRQFGIVLRPARVSLMPRACTTSACAWTAWPMWWPRPKRCKPWACPPRPPSAGPTTRATTGPPSSPTPTGCVWK